MYDDFWDWIVREHDKLSGDVRMSFLRTLKFNRQKVVEVVQNNLERWGMEAVAFRGVNGATINPSLDAPRVVERMEEHFVKELAEIQPA